MSPRAYLLFAFRLVQWCTLAALLWKIGAFAVMVHHYVEIPIDQEFFPAAFRSTALLLLAYFVALAALAVAAVTEHRRGRILACGASLVCVSVLCVHQGSYNDMTFATAWWTSLWSLWLATRIEVDDADPLLVRAAWLSRCMISMILLGGAVGKWTSEYWSGQVLYEIYFVDRDFWFFNLLRRSFDAESLRSVATWYSRNVIVVETACGLGLWLLPARYAATVGVLVLTSIVVFSNIHLFSVLLSLIGLAACGLFVGRESGGPAREAS
ncbi:MAG: hypothetical protein ACO1RT_17800 [Planctomycetaceae bacterium]